MTIAFLIKNQVHHRLSIPLVLCQTVFLFGILVGMDTTLIVIIALLFWLNGFC